MTETRQKQPKYDVRKELEALRVRVANLEVETKRLKRQIPTLDPLERQFLPGPLERVKRGRKQHHSNRIYTMRDQLVMLLERHWSEIEPHCGRWAASGKCLAIPPNIDKIVRILTPELDPSRGYQMQEAAKHLLERVDDLKRFLCEPNLRRCFSGNPMRASSLSSGDPRQLANGLAGVPEIGMWRSLKLCGSYAHRCKFGIADSAIPAYIRRKHPLLARELDADPGLPLLSSFMRTYARRDDPLICHLKADALHRLWKSAPRR